MSTQAYFRMCEGVLAHPCTLELMERESRDNASGSRFYAYICILTDALSPSKEYKDSKMLSSKTGINMRQAQRVWDTCIRHGVLRKATYGYTAREWLIENGFFGKYGCPDAAQESAWMQGVHGRRC